ncbi:MAG: hypothetical protein OIF38_13635, partial [Cellvibrionaceae bacterium]|nr:hypothetical protein [Cellvibrionaceae bacterium]
YKLQFDYPQFRRRLGYSVIVSLLLAFGFACLALAVDEWLLGRRYLGGNWALIAPLLLLGVLRLVYAHFSAVFGARATRQMIVSANAKTLLALLGVSLGAYGTGLVDMLSIVWSACLIWLLRNGFFYAELSAANTALGTEKRG